MEHRKFKKGELVVITNNFPLKPKFNLPPIGKIACSEKVKKEHLSNFPSFSYYYQSLEVAMVEFPHNTIHKIHFLRDLDTLLKDFSEYKLNSVFILERKIVIPIQKDFLYKPKHEPAIEYVRKKWKELKTK